MGTLSKEITINVYSIFTFLTRIGAVRGFLFYFDLFVTAILTVIKYPKNC
jgi:hypothetical protein